MTIRMDTPQSQDVRRVFREMREGHGISLASMAQRIGVSMSKLHKWERNQRKLTLQELYRLTDVLDAAVIERAESAPKESTDGERSKEIRSVYGIGQAEIARATKWPQSTVSMFENGYVTFTEQETKTYFEQLNKLKKKHQPKERDWELFRQIEASLRREIAALEKQVEQSRMTNLSTLRPKGK